MGERDVLERLAESRVDAQALGLHAASVAMGEAAAEITRLRKAFQWCCWDSQGFNGFEFQDEMERRGLLVPVPASPEFRDEYDADTILVWEWDELASRRAEEAERGGEG